MWVVGPGTLNMIDLVPGTESQGTKSGTKLGTKSALGRHQVPARQTHKQPTEIPRHARRCGVAAQTGHEWAKRAKRITNRMKNPSNNICGLGKVHQRFGVELPKVIEEMNRELAT